MKNLIISTCLLLFLFINNVKSTYYASNWTQLDSRPLPGWYDDVKFGIFIHFGLYSVPAFCNNPYGYAEWYWWYLLHDGGDTKAWQDEHYGQNFKYQDFTSLFSCKNFNSDEWASIIEKSGAKYVVLTSKHHEGYTMWNSSQSWNWNSVQNGPGIDVVGELTKSVKNLGLHMGLYHSLYEWYNPLYLADKESGNPPTQSQYVDQVLMPQLMDIVNTYEPHVIWVDGDWEQNSDYWKATDFLSWLYSNSSVKDQVVVNDRWGKDCRYKNGGFYSGGDHWNPGHLVPHKWENCETIGYSYGYNENEPATFYTNSTELIQEFVETIACGGNFLLDVGPNAEGLIPDNMQDRLYDIGYWLEINGEGVYGSSPWRVQNQTDQIWYTTNTTTGAIYAMSFEIPESGILNLEAPIGNKKTQVELLGFKGKQITITLPENDKKPGLSINIPFGSPSDYPPFVYVFKITNAK